MCRRAIPIWTALPALASYRTAGAGQITLNDLVEIRVRAALLVLGGAPAHSPLRANESHECVRL